MRVFAAQRLSDYRLFPDLSNRGTLVHSKAPNGHYHLEDSTCNLGDNGLTIIVRAAYSQCNGLVYDVPESVVREIDAELGPDYERKEAFVVGLDGVAFVYYVRDQG